MPTTPRPRSTLRIVLGKSSEAFVNRRSPQQVFSATPLPGRQATVTTTATSVLALNLTVPAECGANTRHRYLVEQEAWYAGGPTTVEISLSVNSLSHQFGPGTSVVRTEGSYGNAASSRVITLAPGPHTVRLLARAGTAVQAVDPALRAMDLGYTCAGGPTSRTSTSARSAVPGR